MKSQQPKARKTPQKNDTSKQVSKPTMGKTMPPLAIALLLAALSIGLYVNTFSHGYVLDDAIAITHNDFVKNGFAGIADILTFNSNTSMFGKSTNLNVYGRYRPLSYVTFAVEYQLFADNASVGHIVNVLLYGLTAVFMFFLFRLLLPVASRRAQGRGI